MRIRTVSLILVLLVGNGAQLQAYDADTHRAIARRSTQPDVSSLDAVLKTEFGMAGGIGEKVFKGTLQERTLEQLIGEGAFFEDNPVFRVLNHFHNPLAAMWGQAGLRLLGVQVGQSSVLWQQNRAQGSSSGGGNWSWSDARQHYQKALSSPTRLDRDRALADTFRTLGHLTHLIQDASVPAHVRNDPHVSFALLGFKIPINPDWYEDWVEETRKDRVDIFNSLLNAPPIRPPGSIFTPTNDAQAPLPIARLIDTDKFLETSFVPLSDPDIGIAEYANGNYLSRDTIFTDFDLPRQASLGPGFLEPVGQKFRRYFPKVAEGETISHFVTEGALFDSIEAAVGPPPLAGWLLDSRVNQDYAAKLLPRAVGYSAALLDYFFRGRLTVERGPAEVVAGVVRVRVRNLGDERMTGKVTLYYDDPKDGLRKAVGRQPRGFDIDLAPGSAVEFFFYTLDVPEPARTEGRYLAVFAGRLGNEPDAVAATHVQIAPPRPAWVCRGPNICLGLWIVPAAGATLVIEAAATNAEGHIELVPLDADGGDLCGNLCPPSIPVTFGEPPTGTTLSFTAPAPPRSALSEFFMELNVETGGLVCIFGVTGTPEPPADSWPIGQFVNCPE